MLKSQCELVAFLLRNCGGFPRSVLRIALTVALAVLFFSITAPGRAATIQFTATDLADTTPGQDLWQYSYNPDDFTFATGQGFKVFFDQTRYLQLQHFVVNADWDVLTIQPDLILSSPGLYDALTLVNTPSLADPFNVNFVWLGAGIPGSQPFVIYSNDFSTIVQGQTVSVPEPSTFVLWTILGLVGLAATRRKHRA